MNTTQGIVIFGISAIIIRKILLWILTAILFLFFVNASYRKFSGNPITVGHFNDWGYSHGLLITIATLEIIGAVLLLIPVTATSGAVLLALIMTGASYTLLQHHVYSTSVITMATLLILLFFGYCRWEQSWVVALFTMNGK